MDRTGTPQPRETLLAGRAAEDEMGGAVTLQFGGRSVVTSDAAATHADRPPDRSTCEGVRRRLPSGAGGAGR